MKAPTQALDELGTYTMSSRAPMDALARLAAAVGYEARGDRVQAEHHLGLVPSGQARKIRACWWMTTAIVALRAVRCSTGRW